LDVKKRFSKEQIIGFLREAEAGLPVKGLCRQHGFSEASYYLWRSKFGGMSVPDAKRLKELETENGRLKKLLAEQVLENEVIKDALCLMCSGAPTRQRCDRRVLDTVLDRLQPLRTHTKASALNFRLQLGSHLSLLCGRHAGDRKNDVRQYVVISQ
jgi:putative transposase